MTIMGASIGNKKLIKSKHFYQTLQDLIFHSKADPVVKLSNCSISVKCWLLSWSAWCAKSYSFSLAWTCIKEHICLLCIDRGVKYATIQNSFSTTWPQIYCCVSCFSASIFHASPIMIQLQTCRNLFLLKN